MARILVIGGAGYVGASISAWLIDRGHELWVLDDLSTGHRDFALGQGFTHARAGDRKRVAELLKSRKFDCAMHFAARALVEESVRRPDLYRENNVEQTRALVETLLENGVSRFIFSSTCAIFGDPEGKLISETLPRKPINPYGETKLLAEAMLEDYAEKRGLQAIALRYFNAAGAEPGFRVGEWHDPETHLIPRVLQGALADRPVHVYGTDYDTRDGTCVRDYVHVTDLAEAHEAAMLKLVALPNGAGGAFEGFNLGSEKGYTVREVIAACSRVLGKQIEVKESPRRPGDPPMLVADSRQAREGLGFRPGRGIDEIVRSAYEWERKRVAMRRPAVFLDRDGTINHDPGYLSDPCQLALLDGAGEGLAALKRAGYVLVVVSNQSGVARGLIQPDALETIHQKLGDLLRPYCASIDHYELCLHKPEDECVCRKPKPKLLLDAAEKLGLDLSRSYMIGDKRSDIDAGRAAGCKGSILVRTGEGRASEGSLSPGSAAFVAETLNDAARWIART